MDQAWELVLVYKGLEWDLVLDLDTALELELLGQDFDSLTYLGL